MRRYVTVAALALSTIGGRCSRSRERPRASTVHPPAAPAVRDTSPWVHVSGTALHQELDTTSIVRRDSSVYEGWVRRPIESPQGTLQSYHARYEVDCLSGLVRATRAAVYGANGALIRTLTPAEIERSGEARWSDVTFRDLAVAGRAICDRVWDAHLPIMKR
jgi:hypothetical protein